MAKFSEVIECLKNGGMAARPSWRGEQVITMQIPQCIGKDIVPKMTSLNSVIKDDIVNFSTGAIQYHDQVISVTYPSSREPASATYYVPTWEDIFADDWDMRQSAGSYKRRMNTEYDELTDKVTKLNNFIKTDAFKRLSEEKKALMREQAAAMTQYRSILSQRINLEK